METPEQRKERLRALRDAAQLVGKAPTDTDSAAVKFRNYQPRDAALQENKLKAPKAEPFVAPKVEEPNLPENEDPLATFAPKKANWDLRRDVAKRIEKLEKRTQKAMVELMQEEEDKRQMEAAATEPGDAGEDES